MRLWIVVFGIFLVTSAVGCGSGGGSAGTPNFSLLTSPPTVSLNQGATQTFTVYSQEDSSFAGAIAVSFSGLPAGVTASPSTFTLQSNTSSQVVTLSAAASAAIASNIPVTMQASSGPLTHQSSLSLNITGPSSFSLSVQPSNITVIAGTTQTASISVTGINGFSGPVTVSITGLPPGITASPATFNVSPGEPSQVTFTAAASTSGSSTVTFSGTSGSLSAQTQATLSISTTPDFQLSTGNNNGFVIYAGSSGTFTVTATGYNGFTTPITVSLSGFPAGVTASPTTFSISPGSSQTVTVSTQPSATGTQTVITVQGVGGGLSHQAQFNLLLFASILTLQVQPSSLTIPSGSSSGVEVSFAANNATIGTLSLTVTGLPSGVTASPSSLNASAPGKETEVYFSAATGATGGTVIFTATYGPLTQTVSLPVTIGPAETNKPVAIKSRSIYFRTDSTSEYSSFPPPNWTVYDSATQRFFASDPNTNHVNVFDSTTEKQIATLVIPGAFGMDEAPDHSVLYVGTMSGDLYLVDPVNLVVTQRYPSDTISAYGYPANAVYALANGKLLLERYFLLPGYSWVDGNGPIALWNPADNSIVKFVGQGASDGLMPEETTCLEGFESGILTNNRSRFLMTPILTGGGSSVLCSFDPNADTWVWSPTIIDGDYGALSTFAVSPDGNTVAAYDGTKVYVLDAATLQVKNSFAVTSTQSLASIPSMVIGPDNQTVYLSGAANNQLLYAYNLTTGVQTGWLPQVQVMPAATYTPSVPLMQGISTNGLIGGVMEQGFGLLDTSAINPMPVGTSFGTGLLLGPAYGPVTGGTTTSWYEGPLGVSNPPPLGSAYFGPNIATGVSTSAFDNQTIYATTPSGAPGPVDVFTTTTDGGEQILPDAFSYGPWVLEAPTNYATAEGGGPAQVYGYGMGSSYIPNLTTQSVTPPADLLINIGGLNTVVTGYMPGPYSADSYFSLPFPLVGAKFTVPPGATGSSVDINVSNSAGSTVVKQGLTYLPSVQSFPVNGQLLDGVYDSLRDVYYFTDVNQIRVFSRTQGKWLSPIPVPPATGAYGPQRLFGIALSPDDSKLAVSDAGAFVIYVIDPDNPSSITNYPLASKIIGDVITETPSGIAITNSGQIYFTTFDQDGDGSPFLLNLDPATGNITPLGGEYAPSTEGDIPYGRVPMSADGTRIYFNNEGAIGYIETATGATTFCTECGDLGQGGYEIVLGSNQTSIYSDGFMMDSQLNIIGFQALNWRESFDADYVYGATLSADGSLLFQPGLQSIDIFDGRTGAFRGRISLSVPLSPNYRALVGDGKDNVQVAITEDSGNGIAVIDLSAVPEPNPLPYLIPHATHGNLSASSKLRNASPAQTISRNPATPKQRLRYRTRKFVLER